MRWRGRNRHDLFHPLGGNRVRAIEGILINMVQVEAPRLDTAQLNGIGHNLYTQGFQNFSGDNPSGDPRRCLPRRISTTLKIKVTIFLKVGEIDLARSRKGWPAIVNGKLDFYEELCCLKKSK